MRGKQQGVSEMKAGRLAIGAALIVAVSSSAWAVPLVPMPSGGGNWTFSAHAAYAEVFLEVKQEIPGIPLAPGVYNDIAIGFTDNDGTGSPAFVLYTGAQAQATNATLTVPAPQKPNRVVFVDPTGANIEQLFKGIPDPQNPGGPPLTRGRLFGTGIIQTIRAEGSDPIPFRTDPDANGGATRQLTFVLYNAHVDDMDLYHGPFPQIPPFPGTNYAGITTTFVKEGTEAYHVDVYVDKSADANDGMPNDPPKWRYASARKYAEPPSPAGPYNVDTDGMPELPLVDDLTGTLLVNLDTGAYYDPDAAADPGGREWGQMGFSGTPGDADEVVAWSFVANPESELRLTETFYTAIMPDKGQAELFDMYLDLDFNGVPDSPTPIQVYGAGVGNVYEPPPGFWQLIPGPSLIGDPTKIVTNAAGEEVGYLNHYLIQDESYLITGSYLYGGVTGAYDSDPRTWTFQQWEAHELLQLKGPFVPEPLTMLGVLLAAGGIGGYVRRRRSR